MGYEEFLDKVEELSLLGDVEEQLNWDKETVMPEKGLKARNRQMTVVNNIRHRELTGEELGELMESVKDTEKDRRQKAIFREIKRHRERALEVPDELQERISEQSSETVDTWKEAKKEDDFGKFAEELKKMVELKREYAREIDDEREPYKVLFENFEPYMDLEEAERIIERVKENLKRFFGKVKDEAEMMDKGVLDKSLSDEKNMELAEKAANAIGLDEGRTRIDLSEHPFTMGTQFDSRITTRFKDDSVAENIAATLHEGGHALYNLGVPKEEYGNPLGEPRELTIHESQSRLWENHVGRSLEFWEFFREKMQEVSEEFEGIEAEEFFRAVNSIDPENKIRTEADEISYHLHIALRFELERKLVNGEVEVEELPELWNQKMEELLGVRPENDREGVLQDIHWAWGEFGYFPTYTLGTVLAAQLYAKAEEEIDELEAKIADGDFEPLLEWLRENIQGHGQRYRTQELIEKATGEKLNEEYFLDYIEEKYSRLCGLEGDR